MLLTEIHINVELAYAVGNAFIVFIRGIAVGRIKTSFREVLNWDIIVVVMITDECSTLTSAGENHVIA